VPSKFVSEVLKIINEIVSANGYEKFFSNDTLNSEGRKRIEKIAKLTLNKCKQTKPYLAKVRRKPTYNSVMKYFESILKCLEELK